MMNQPKTFAELGWKDEFPNKLHLLPLLEPDASSTINASYPPLHLLPGETINSSKVVFETQKPGQGGKFKWVATNHVFPAAYPRSHPQSVRQPNAKSVEPRLDASVLKANLTELKELRKKYLRFGMKMIENIQLEAFIPPFTEQEANERAQELLKDQQPQLWCCVQRIVPIRSLVKEQKQERVPLTLLFAHATGFQKEIWQPMMKRLVESIENDKQSQYYVEEIWSLDNFRSGDSALLNAKVIGPAISSHDASRDIQQFIRFYLPQQNDEDLSNVFHPPNLVRQQEEDKSRKIIAIGHSAGAAAMTMAFATDSQDGQNLQLVDGFISFEAAYFCREMILDHTLPHLYEQSLMTLVRKDLFGSKEEILDYLKKAPMFKFFDQRTRELYMDYGFQKVEFPNDPQQKEAYTMKMSKWSEACSFAQIWTNCWTTSELKRTNWNGWLHKMYSEEVAKTTVPIYQNVHQYHDKLCKERQKSQNNLQFTLQDLPVQHLYPMEKPDQCGNDFAKIILAKMQNKEPFQTKTRTWKEFARL